MAREGAESKPIGVCEKLFNALNFNLSFRPLRRFTFHAHSDNGDHQSPLAVPVQHTQPHKAAAVPPPPAPSPKLATTTVPRFENAQDNKTVPMPTPPKPLLPPAVLPKPAPPKAMAQPHRAADETKKTINEKATEFIHNTKLKIRSGSFGRAPTIKKPSS